MPMSADKTGMLELLFAALLVALSSVPECDLAKLHYRSSIEAGDDLIRLVLVISSDRYLASLLTDVCFRR